MKQLQFFSIRYIINLFLKSASQSPEFTEKSYLSPLNLNIMHLRQSLSFDN